MMTYVPGDYYREIMERIIRDGRAEKAANGYGGLTGGYRPTGRKATKTKARRLVK